MSFIVVFFFKAKIFHNFMIILESKTGELTKYISSVINLK